MGGPSVKGEPMAGRRQGAVPWQVFKGEGQGAQGRAQSEMASRVRGRRFPERWLGAR